VSEEAKHPFGVEPLPASTALVPYAVRVNASLVRRGFWPKIRRVAAHIPFAEDAVALWFCTLDRETPATTKAILFAALAWFVMPKPFRPRKVPVPGVNLADEAAVIAAAISFAQRSIRPIHREKAKAILSRLARS